MEPVQRAWRAMIDVRASARSRSRSDARELHQPAGLERERARRHARTFLWSLWRRFEVHLLREILADRLEIGHRLAFEAV